MKILVVTFSSSGIEWCLRSDPEIVERKFFLKRKCQNPYYNLMIIDLLRDKKPDMFIFGSQNEASGSSLHDNVALGVSEALGYRLIKKRSTRDNNLIDKSTILVSTSIFLHKDYSRSSIGFTDENFELIDSSSGRKAVAQGISFIGDPDDTDYLIINVYLPAPTEYKSLPKQIYRLGVLAANARFLNEVTKEYNKSKRVIMFGDFDTKFRDSEAKNDVNNDEMTLLKDVLNLDLKEEDILFKAMEDSETAGWSDRIFFSYGMDGLEYDMIGNGDTDHYPIYALIDNTKFAYGSKPGYVGKRFRDQTFDEDDD